MAISSSGAVSFANVQTEYGGSNPISLNEYYSGGSLVKANTSSTNDTSTIGRTAVTVTSGKTSYTNDVQGWYHPDSMASGHPFEQFSTNIGDDSASIAKISGADLTGNSGAIPSSGTIDINKFRGTNAGTDGTFTCYGITTSRGGSSQIGSFHVLIAGHLGTATNPLNYPDSSAFTGCPFASISFSANGTMLASTASPTSSQSGSIVGRLAQFHYTGSNIGAYTEFRWSTVSGDDFASSGNLTVTFNF